MKILVTGMGVISGIGNNVEENLTSLKAAKHGITNVTGIPYMRKPFVGGQVKTSDVEFYDKLNISEDIFTHRSTLLGLTAAKEAWGENTKNKNIKDALIFGTTIGGVDLGGEKIIEHAQRTGEVNMDMQSIHHRGFGTDFLVEKIGIDAQKFTISTACSTAANSLMLGARLIRAGKADRVLAGGAEALTNYLMNGFDSLMLYDPDPCKPFDENRKGLNLGEAGAFVVLESERSVAITKNKIYAELAGWANTCDSYHITASSPDGKGATLAIEEALALANLSPDKVDYINAHGTGTSNNDLSECIAMKNVFGDAVPAFSSTKAFTGHTLAGAGSVEAVFSILALQHNFIPVNLHHKVPMKEVSFRPSTQPVQHKTISCVLSNSFGFGGNCTELIFVK